jgi:cytohesin
MTPLHLAAKALDGEMVELLLANDADVGRTDNLGRTPLHWVGVPTMEAFLAELTGQQEWDSAQIAELLVAAGADVGAKDAKDMTSLHLAAHAGDAALVELLTGHGAAVDTRDRGGRTPLHWAGGQADSVGITAPVSSAQQRRRRAGTVERLLSSGANVNAVDQRGATPNESEIGGRGGAGVPSSSAHDLTPATRDLLDRASSQGVQVNLSSAQRRGGPGAAQIEHLTGNMAEFADLLLAHGYDSRLVSRLVRALGKDGVNLVKALADRGVAVGDSVWPIERIAARDATQIVKLLLAAGANPNTRDNRGLVPLHRAVVADSIAIYRFDGAQLTRESVPVLGQVGQRRRDTVRLLLDSGALVDALSPDGQTALHMAVGRGNRAMVELLLRHGARVNVASEGGETPLHRAAQHDDREVIELLIDHGAQLNARDKEGNTPVGVALMNGRKEVAEFLRARGGVE